MVPLALWLLYLSLLNGGTMMMNYGWEWLTLELGFIGIFLCPVFCLTATLPQPPTPATGTGKGTFGWFPPPRLVLWLFRWCAFRLLIGAGYEFRSGRAPGAPGLADGATKVRLGAVVLGLGS